MGRVLEDGEKLCDHVTNDRRIVQVCVGTHKFTRSNSSNRPPPEPVRLEEPLSVEVSFNLP